jgi:uncharacterized protein DUF6644
VESLVPLFARLEMTAVGTTIAQSVLLTGALSAAHLVGFTLLMGSALVSNLRLTGVLFPNRPLVDITMPGARGVAAGLAISVVTGLLLFSARASAAAQNRTFQIKMLLLVGAAVFQFGVQSRMLRRIASAPWLAPVSGVVGLLLWFGVAAAACAFILLE